MMENLVWKAYYHSMSGHEIRPFNIFEHGRFREEVRKLLLKCTEKEAFAEELRRSLFYYYCSKCEWEVVIGPWCGDRGTKEIKVDVYMQVMNNWDIFVDHVWNEGKTMSVSTDTERIFRIGGYVKRAKLNLRNEREIRAFHRNAIERWFGDFEDGTLVDVYIDITGYKETAKRPEMLRLMRDCADGKVNLIFAETKGYLSANTREFCYWLHFIFNLKERVDIITDDDQFNINTILNADKQREALIKMAEDYIYLNPPDHQKWLNGVVSAITNLREDG